MQARPVHPPYSNPVIQEAVEGIYANVGRTALSATSMRGTVAMLKESNKHRTGAMPVRRSGDDKVNRYIDGIGWISS